MFAFVRVGWALIRTCKPGVLTTCILCLKTVRYLWILSSISWYPANPLIIHAFYTCLQNVLILTTVSIIEEVELQRDVNSINILLLHCTALKKLISF